jgi:GNAT superfamily N-acetyltransferase
VKLRHPNEGDWAHILPVARQLHEESWFRNFDFDPDMARQFFDACLFDPMFFAIVAEQEGVIAGFFVAAATRHIFGRDLYACDMLFYLAPEHRSGMTAARMIRAYEAWCRIKKVKEIHIGVSSGISTERTAEFYRRMGYGDPLMAFRKLCILPPRTPA